MMGGGGRSRQYKENLWWDNRRVELRVGLRQSREIEYKNGAEWVWSGRPTWASAPPLGIEGPSRIKSVSLVSLLWLGERMTTDTESVDERDLGLQPLDALMVARGVDNHALVAASPTQLTHKQVQRARKGRRLTKNMQAKVLDAWLRVAGGQEKVADLFNYRGL